MRRTKLSAAQRAERTELGDHIAGFGLVMLVLIAANASMPTYPWVLWPLAIWGVFLVAHTVVVVKHTHAH